MELFVSDLFFHYKKLQLYAEIFLAAVMSLHPITIVLSFYYWAQIPIKVLFDLTLYPIYPEFDVPKIDYDNLNYFG